MKIKFIEFQPGIYGVEIDGRFTSFAEARGQSAELLKYYPDMCAGLDVIVYGKEGERAILELYIYGIPGNTIPIRLAESGPGLVMGNGLTYRTRSSGRRLCLRETQQGLEDFLSKLTPLIDWEAGDFRESVEVSFHLRNQAPARAERQTATA